MLLLYFSVMFAILNNVQHETQHWSLININIHHTQKKLRTKGFPLFLSVSHDVSEYRYGRKEQYKRALPRSGLPQTFELIRRLYTRNPLLPPATPASCLIAIAVPLPCVNKAPTRTRIYLIYLIYLNISSLQGTSFWVKSGWYIKITDIWRQRSKGGRASFIRFRFLCCFRVVRLMWLRCADCFECLISTHLG